MSWMTMWVGVHPVYLESAAAGDRRLEEYLHLYLLNRGVLITPFHNMALMCPATTPAQVERHSDVFGTALEEIYA